MTSPKKITLFLLLTATFTGLSYIPMLRAGTAMAGYGLFVLLAMWSPGVAAILTQLIATRGLRGLGWHFGSARWLGLGYLLPVLYGLPVYAFAWATGLGSFINPYTFSETARRFGSPDLAGALTAFVLVNATWGFILPNLLLALGEEIGWRGFLVPELAKVTSFTRTALISGVIWAAWHMPGLFLLDLADGKTPIIYEALSFGVMIIGTSFAYAWLTLRSGSLWPAAVLHAAHNLWIQGVFDSLTGDAGFTPYITGEFGAGLALTGLVVAYAFWRQRLHARRQNPAASSQSAGSLPAAERA